MIKTFVSVLLIAISLFSNNGEYKEFSEIGGTYNTDIDQRAAEWPETNTSYSYDDYIVYNFTKHKNMTVMENELDRYYFIVPEEWCEKVEARRYYGTKSIRFVHVASNGDENDLFTISHSNKVAYLEDLEYNEPVLYFINEDKSIYLSVIQNQQGLYFTDESSNLDEYFKLLDYYNELDDRIVFN